MDSHSQKEVNKAIDGFKKSQNGQSCKTDSIFNSSSNNGKGDSPRNISNKFKKNYDAIFPNAYKPSWQKPLNENR